MVFHIIFYTYSQIGIFTSFLNRTLNELIQYVIMITTELIKNILYKCLFVPVPTMVMSFSCCFLEHLSSIMLYKKNHVKHNYSLSIHE